MVNLKRDTILKKKIKPDLQDEKKNIYYNAFTIINMFAITVPPQLYRVSSRWDAALAKPLGLTGSKDVQVPV